MKRDFTYVDDIVSGVIKIVSHIPTTEVPFKIYNIGNSNPVDLMDFISAIENASGKKAILNMMEMQPGDVVTTYADTSHLQRDFGYKPATTIQDGIDRFHQWYIQYMNQDLTD